MSRPDDPVVRTSYGKINDQGYIEDDGPQSHRSVELQVRAVLAQVKDADGVTAEDYLEWISGYRADGSLAQGDDPFPEGHAYVTAGQGSSEGWLIRVFVDHRDDQGKRQLHNAMTIKFLANRDLVYEAAKWLSIAFDSGCYGYEERPREVAA